MLFHYDGRTSEWDQFEWSARAVHVSVRKQTKWWYAKRFLHPDIVAAYDYIFIWDEDLGVEHFNGDKYIQLAKKHGLEISQPGLEPNDGLTWQMTKKIGIRTTSQAGAVTRICLHVLRHPIEDSWIKKGIIQDKVEKEGLEMNEDTLVNLCSAKALRGTIPTPGISRVLVSKRLPISFGRRMTHQIWGPPNIQGQCIIDELND
ncbi:trimethylguanosine synthase [Actinidia rufa]|uniref:Trimethylguanosine synthase n=1 Tax=Actinidia rufa TaxID=165716 RepID=A0A7J0GQP5_9ERIC|nr:trimethylguanosine synthase [Actinidia rufa]